ncbi:MAG: hypothetical protein ACFB4J_15225 [Elainellaceae cyanobacterium]
MTRSSISKVAIAQATAVITLFGAVGTALAQSAPAQVTAPADQLSISMSLLPGESYEDFVERAEEAVAQQVQRYFQRTAAERVMVTFNGSNSGLVAPVLELDVTREQWTAVPQTVQWATYFPDGEVLLGLAEPAPQPNPAVTETDGGEPSQPTVTEDSPAVTITTPSGDVDSAIDAGADSSGGDRADDATQEDTQPAPSTITPDSDVAPLEVPPDAGTTSSGSTIDSEDSNDLETVPDDNSDGANVIVEPN